MSDTNILDNDEGRGLWQREDRCKVTCLGRADLESQ